MRVFLSVYPNFTLAIPMDVVASMMLYNQETEKTIQYDQKSRCTFISLPWLFNMRDQPVPHGVILREFNSKENKVVLLTAEVKRVIEIPDEDFFPMPKALGALRFSTIFSGIKFSDNPVLLLNVEQLLQIIQKEQWAPDKETNPPEQPVPTASSVPSPPAPNKIVEEPPSPAEASKPSPPELNKVIEEPPSPAEASEPSPPELNKVIEEPPASPMETSETPESFSLALDEVLEVCELIEEPPASPAETPESFSLALDEVLEVCELIEEQPPSPAETPESFSLTLDEDLEVYEVIEDQPISIVETPESFSLTLDEDLEVYKIIDESPMSLWG